MSTIIIVQSLKNKIFFYYNHIINIIELILSSLGKKYHR